ncbi:MAG: hypothetical protein WAX89_06865 [Alphaproteobacteria bacterium]
MQNFMNESRQAFTRFRFHLVALGLLAVAVYFYQPLWAGVMTVVTLGKASGLGLKETWPVLVLTTLLVVGLFQAFTNRESEISTALVYVDDTGVLRKEPLLNDEEPHEIWKNLAVRWLLVFLSNFTSRASPVIPIPARMLRAVYKPIERKIDEAFLDGHHAHIMGQPTADAMVYLALVREPMEEVNGVKPAEKIRVMAFPTPLLDDISPAAASTPKLKKAHHKLLWETVLNVRKAHYNRSQPTALLRYPKRWMDTTGGRLPKYFQNA